MPVHSSKIQKFLIRAQKIRVQFAGPMVAQLPDSRDGPRRSAAAAAPATATSAAGSALSIFTAVDAVNSKSRVPRARCACVSCRRLALGHAGGLVPHAIAARRRVLSDPLAIFLARGAADGSRPRHHRPPTPTPPPGAASGSGCWVMKVMSDQLICREAHRVMYCCPAVVSEPAAVFHLRVGDVRSAHVRSGGAREGKGPGSCAALR